MRYLLVLVFFLGVFPSIAMADGGTTVDLRVCRWLDALAYFVILGGFVSFVIVRLMRRVVKIPASKDLNWWRRGIFDHTVGVIERIMVGLITLVSVEGAFAIGVAWATAKLAANWRRTGRLESLIGLMTCPTIPRLSGGQSVEVLFPR